MLGYEDHQSSLLKSSIVYNGFFLNGFRLDQKTAIYPKIVYKVKDKQIS